MRETPPAGARTYTPAPAAPASLATTRSAGMHSSLFRQVADALVCLALAVAMFRTFEVEGYMISTGSMAPCLLGYHKRVVCPECRHQFEFGASSDEAAIQDDGEHREGLVDRSVGRLGADSHTARYYSSDEWATCPNCGQHAIDVGGVPLNQGDQLLVHKNAYMLRSPERWEVVVFRNPGEPTQAYVKRVAGLPGETIELKNGDVYANEQIQRKDLQTQRGMRVLVHDYEHQPDDDDQWQPRWLSEPGESRWNASAAGLAVDASGGETAWLRYRHWVRDGGYHHTTVVLERLPDEANVSFSTACPVAYDHETGLLSCRGAMPAAWRDRLLALSDDEEFTSAIDTLYMKSHIAPVTDDYGYNRAVGGVPPTVVRDLMLSMQVQAEGSGELLVQMNYGTKSFDCALNLGEGTVQLYESGTDIAVATGELPEGFGAESFLLEMSTFDRQVVVAIDGEPILPAWPFSAPEESDEGMRQPVRIGARGISAELSSLELYRDVFYSQRAGHRQYSLTPDEYFMLGDNSPVSYDSRSWPTGSVHRNLLLGKPFVVHLPSRPGRIEVGPWSGYIRIPDFSRIRYIH